MIKPTLLMVTVLTFIAAAVPAASPSSEGPAVAEVLVFDASTTVPKFLEISKRADAIGEKYGTRGRARTWVNAYAGANTGSIVVVVEYPNMMALAESTSKMRATPEWRKLVADAQASGVKLVSDSIVVEVKNEM